MTSAGDDPTVTFLRAVYAAAALRLEVTIAHLLVDGAVPDIAMQAQADGRSAQELAIQFVEDEAIRVGH